MTSHSNPISPRTEALGSILAVRESYQDATIGAETWDELVGVAWETRSQIGDRRDVQRVLRQILLQASRQAEKE